MMESPFPHQVGALSDRDPDEVAETRNRCDGFWMLMIRVTKRTPVFSARAPPNSIERTMAPEKSFAGWDAADVNTRPAFTVGFTRSLVPGRSDNGARLFSRVSRRWRQCSENVSDAQF